MERKEKNPYVTKTDLNEVENKLNAKIIVVDRKLDEHKLETVKWFEVSELTSKHMIEVTKQMKNSIDDLAVSMKEITANNQEYFKEVTKKVQDHEIEIKSHSNYIEEQKTVSEGKRKQLLQWMSIISTVFIAILAGIFGVIEVVIPFFLGGE